MASLFRRRAIRRRGYEAITRRGEEDGEEKASAYEAVTLEEEGLGTEELEARGDRFMARGQRRASRRWFVSFKHETAFAVAEDFRLAGLSYVLAKNWRKAAAAFGNEAIQRLKSGSPHADLAAAVALLASARCYRKILHKDEVEVGAIKFALKKAAAMFVEGKNLQSAATCCRELAEFHEERGELHHSLRFFLQARDYYRCNPNRNEQGVRYCHATGNLVRCRILLLSKGRPSSSSN
uniref:MalT-like TPR region domain-containing protein n=1 Tax=Leersia perrieri TaxID=77586 RepID=A0A0D9V703_9ORYZ